MSSSLHPVIQKAALSFPVSSPWYEDAARLALRWETTVQTIERLEAGDASAEHILRQAFGLLSQLTVAIGSIHGWTLAQRHFLYRHARRLFGEQQRLFQAPGWTER